MTTRDAPEADRVPSLRQRADGVVVACAMPIEPKHQPDRTSTDESLRAERAKADRVVSTTQAAVANEADVIVERARDEADDVLVEARATADRETAERASIPGARATLRDERERADEALRVERRFADESLERDTTDRFLLTERARADDALAHRDDFLGMVSHDLRNLLGGIVLSTAVMSETTPDGDVGNALLVGAARIQRYAARMNRLIGDLLDVASIDRGELAVTRTPGDLRATIAEAIDLFQVAASKKDIQIQLERSAGPILGDFDHGRILQVLANLITNALKFTANGGVVSIRAARASAELSISIRDTGCGIPAGALEDVFERFWQAGEHDRRGSGLGLYISRCIVEAHGGKIWAESVVGTGSTFSLTFPVTAAPRSTGA